MNLDRIPAGKNIPDSLNVIVEIPKGSQNKYEFDKELNVLKLDRVLYSPMVYPGDYGFVPQTLAKDGDPLDVLVLVTNATFPGTLIEARPVGVLKMVDQGQEDDKVLCVPVHDIRFSGIKDIDDVEEPYRNEIAHFFQVYKELEGKKVEIKGWEGRDATKPIIEGAVKAYKS